MLFLYTYLTSISERLLDALLKHRLDKGKENAQRVNERRGVASIERPEGKLIWLHAASVGEAQSALILIETLLEKTTNTQILVTSGTVTSATLMAKKLPQGAFHQYVPLDHPEWVEKFMNHWKPDLVFWMESELWPNMLQAIKEKNIPAFLMNARLSDSSFNKWRLFKQSALTLLSTFDRIFAQTMESTERFKALGAEQTIFSDNIKYSAAPLTYNEDDLNAFKNAIQTRPTWVYASTHNGEEQLALQAHQNLKRNIPDLLTIIVPRHPERRDEIKPQLSSLNTLFRGEEKTLPTAETDIYVADTLGELGLFYTSSDIAMIGRSFSRDGGGGHNPIEAAQLNCATLTGPNVQFQMALFGEMIRSGAAIQIETPKELIITLSDLLANEEKRKKIMAAGQEFSTRKNNIINIVMEAIEPTLQKVLS